ncbi:MAG: glycoside hydrolase family 13 protein [Bacteroidetes bacterium]|nr:glycoside hydrolase family 13 protein [Bacteroidota bacterium]
MKNHVLPLILTLTMSPAVLTAQPEFVPNWAKSAIWYQIFPERFFNGDRSNEPTLDYISLAWPFDSKSAWQIHPWTSDWYELQPYEKRNKQGLQHNLLRRRYGGDLQGIIDKLDYLQGLGVTAIYLNPVFMAPSHHKYDGMMYHHIDPFLGPDPRADIKKINQEVPDDPASWVWTEADKLALKLIAEVHQRGMKIIFDGVFNHMGINSFAFQDVKKNQENSRFKDWFTVTSWDDPAKGTRFQYEGWFGVAELPELREDENGIVQGPKDYIFASTRRWMDPNENGNGNDGIDGWRLDVAFCVKHPFWKEWRKLVRELNPEAYITAEIIDPVPVLQPYLQGDEFDAVMNYNFAFISSDFFIARKNRITVTEFDRRLKELREAFPGGVSLVQQNLFGSHDANRIGSAIVNRDLGRYGDWGDYFNRSKSTNPEYQTRKPTPEEYKVQKLFAIFQMTYPGAPMIYYGDETGMWGANDPDCRKPMIWEEFDYDPEAVLPDSTLRKTPDKVGFNRDLFSHYQLLFKIRKETQALNLGSFETLLTDDKQQVFAFRREYNGQQAVVILNASEKPAQANLKLKGAWKDVLNAKPFTPGSLEKPVQIKPLWALILVQ